MKRLSCHVPAPESFVPVGDRVQHPRKVLVTCLDDTPVHRPDGEVVLAQVLRASGRRVVQLSRWRMGPAGQDVALTTLRLLRERGSNDHAQGAACCGGIGTFATKTHLPPVLHCRGDRILRFWMAHCRGKHLIWHREDAADAGPGGVSSMGHTKRGAELKRVEWVVQTRSLVRLAGM